MHLQMLVLSLYTLTPPVRTEMTNLTKDSNKVTNPHLKKSICLSPLRCGCLLIALVWFALSPVARADSPSNTRLGVQALQGNTTGELNTGIGWRALQEDSTGNGNYFEINSPVAVWSPGPDKMVDHLRADRGANKDNILSWK